MSELVSAMKQTAFNRKAADILRECATLLTSQDANPFRINAYIRAAQTLEGLSEDASEILHREGESGLVKLPAIGTGIAAAIAEIERTGRLALLDRMRGSADPAVLFRVVPGIGPALAREIHDTLNIDTLEALEIAAHDGRLESVDGIGARRAAAIRASLESILGRARRARASTATRPTVHTILEVDREYREKAANNELPRIAPKRFNPRSEAWLPIMHTERDGWHFTALFSNTATAHKLKRTRDWVVIYYYDGDHQEEQCTVVTETSGQMKNQRVVRGRESDCLSYRTEHKRAS